MDEPASGPAFSDAGLAKPADRSPAGAADEPEPLGRPLVPAKEASPRLAGKLFARLLSYGRPQSTSPGDVLFQPGDEDVDLIAVARGSVEVIRAETVAVPAATVAKVGAGGFVGELNLMTGQNAYLLCRVREAGTVYRVSPRAPPAADGERRRAVRHHLQGAGRAPRAAAPQRGGPGGGDRR